MDECRICFEVCFVKLWKMMGVEEFVCEVKDGFLGGCERIEVFCDDVVFLNFVLVCFSIVEFISCFLYFVWKEVLFCFNFFVDIFFSNLLMVVNLFLLYVVLEYVKCKIFV